MQNLSSANLNYVNSILKKQQNDKVQAQKPANSEIQTKTNTDTKNISQKKSLKEQILKNKKTIILGALALGAFVFSILAFIRSGKISKALEEGQKETNALVGGIETRLDAMTDTLNDLNKNKDDIQNGMQKGFENIKEGLQKSAQSLGEIKSNGETPQLDSEGAQKAVEAAVSTLQEEGKKAISSVQQEAQKSISSLNQSGQDLANSLHQQGQNAVSSVSQEAKKIASNLGKNALDAMSCVQEEGQKAVSSVQQEAQKTVETAVSAMQQESQKAALSVSQSAQKALDAVQIQKEGALEAVKKQGEKTISDVAQAANKSAQEAIQEVHIKEQKSIEGINSTLDGAIKKMADLNTQASKNIPAPAQQIVQETAKTKTPLTLKEVEFKKGVAYLKGSGEKVTGSIKDTMPNGKSFSLFYRDGEIQTAQTENFQKIYDTEIKDGKIGKRIRCSSSNDVDSVYVYKCDQNDPINGMGARKYLIDKVNKLKREILSFSLKDGKYERIAAQDGPCAAAVNVSGYDNKLSEQIVEYNARALAKGDFAPAEKIALEKMPGYVAYVPPRYSSPIYRGTIERKENGKISVVPDLFSNDVSGSVLTKDSPKGSDIKFDKNHTKN